MLANDFDPEGDVLLIISGVDPAGGTVTAENGKLVDTPPADSNGISVLTHLIGDAPGNEAQATVEVTVRPANHAPDAVQTG